MLREISSGVTFMELIHAWLPRNTSKGCVCLYLSGGFPQSRGLWKPTEKEHSDLVRAVQMSFTVHGWSFATITSF